MRITTNKWRMAAAAILLAVAAAVFAVFPETLWMADAKIPSAAVLFTVFFLGCLALDFGSGREAPVAALTLAVCVAALLVATDALGPAPDPGSLPPGAGSRYAVLYGAGIVLGVVGVLYALTGSLPWGMRLAALVLALFGYVGYFVHVFRSDPFVPIDIYGAGTALQVLPSYRIALTPRLAETALVFAGILLVSSRLRLSGRTRGIRFAIRAAALAAALLFFGLTTTRRHMEHFGVEPYFWDQKVSIALNGNLVNFTANIPYLAIPRPPGYSLEALAGITGAYISDDAASATLRPDVILILGESWADLAPEGVVRTTLPSMPFLSGFRNREDGVYGDLVVSTTGGGTSCAEFEILSGVNLQLGMNTAPFMTLVKEPKPTLAAFFKQMGYRTAGIHNGEKTAWGRDAAYPLLGFDRFLGQDDMNYPDNSYSRGFLRDGALYRKALSLLDEAEEPLFLFAITLETHGGYTDPNYASEVRVEGEEGKYPQTEQFLGLMRSADAEFAEFMRALEKRERPTLVVAFGDHLPVVEYEYWLKALTPKGGVLWEHTTFYVMWSNFDAPLAGFGAIPAIGNSYLGVFLTQCAGLPLTGYQKFLLDCFNDWPAITPRGAYDGMGRFVHIKDAEQSESYRRQAIMQYNLIMDRENLAKDFFYLRPAAGGRPDLGTRPE